MTAVFSRGAQLLNFSAIDGRLVSARPLGMLGSGSNSKIWSVTRARAL